MCRRSSDSSAMSLASSNSLVGATARACSGCSVCRDEAAPGALGSWPMGVLQIGQELSVTSHRSIQRQWYICMHGIVFKLSPPTKSSRQIVQRDWSPILILHLQRWTGNAAMSPLRAGRLLLPKLLNSLLPTDVRGTALAFALAWVTGSLAGSLLDARLRSAAAT